MRCEYCSKKIEGKRDKRFCNKKCNNKYYYLKNKIKYYNLCKCGSKKHIKSKQCRKCYSSNKLKGLSRLKK